MSPRRKPWGFFVGERHGLARLPLRRQEVRLQAAEVSDGEEGRQVSEVVRFTGITKADLPVEQVLTEACKAQIEPVLVLGYDEDGELYAASSTSDEASLVLLMELFKHRLLAGNYK